MTPAADDCVEVDALVVALAQSMIRAQRRLDRRVEALVRRFFRGAGRRPLRVRAGDETIDVALSDLVGHIGSQISELRVELAGTLVTLQTADGERLGLRTDAAADIDDDVRRIMVATLRPRAGDADRVAATLELDGVLLREGSIGAPERPPPRPPPQSQAAAAATRERVYLFAPRDAAKLTTR
ncbi:MAG: hypothetical protein KC486_06385 [Myxococcales bacterium]|nr:hypothetical protein [Myxococcales bacterium]